MPPPPLILCHAAELIETPQHPHILYVSSGAPRQRKRGQEAGLSSPQDGDRPPSKRPRTSPSSCTAKERTASDTSEKNVGPLEYWTRTRRWPKEYFEQDSQVREDLEQDSWLEEQLDYSTQVLQYVEINGFRYPRPIRKALASLRRKQSDLSLTGSSNQEKRESKSCAYRDTRYITLSESKEALWTNQTQVLRMQVRVFAVAVWTRTRTSQRIHCLEMICLKQLAERSKTGMKRGLFKIPLD